MKDYALLDEIPSDGSGNSESEDERENVGAANNDSASESEDESPLQTYVVPKEVIWK